MEEVNQLLNFMVEVEKLKGVSRKTMPIGLNRYENSAEHSWHVSLMALLLKDYSDEEIDINRVIKMLLIHDLGEIEAGDKIVYQNEFEEVKQKEYQGIKALVSLLPESLANDMMSLWVELEKGVSPEAKFAKAIDRVPPLLHNIYGEANSWKTHKVPKEKVYELNKARIQDASQSLWLAVENELDQAVKSGRLD